MFGRKRRRDDEDYDDYYADEDYDEADFPSEDYPEPAPRPARGRPRQSARDPYAYDYADEEPDEFDDPDTQPQRRGPYDYDDVAEALDAVREQRLDLGSVILPVPPGGQLQVELDPQGAPQAVHLALEGGRITVAAYAAPKSSGQWRTVAADLTESLRGDGARVSIEKGPWGREIYALTEDADVRFIGVDGKRWMVRLVVAGRAGSGVVVEGSPLVAAARAVLSETVVRRGADALPVRDPLPVVLPQELAEQLVAAHQEQLQAMQQQEQAAAAQASAQRSMPTGAVLPESSEARPRRAAGGSAMQQLGRN